MTDTRTHGGLWREEVYDRIDRLRDEVASMTHDGSAAELDRTRTHLSRAEKYADEEASPREWWSGSRIERCWRELRLAEVDVLRGAPEAQVRAYAVEALSHGSWYLDTADPRVKELAALLARAQPDRHLRDAAVAVLVAGHGASDKRHRALRSFKNGLRALTGLLLALAVLALLAAWVLDWTLLPTAVSSQQAAASEPENALAQWSAVGLAMFFGALGALFSAIPSLAQIPERVTTFNPLREQAALKVAVGAWSAVIGLMAVSAGLNTRMTQTDSLAGFAMVAALFGAGQEAITRFADHKATDLRESGEQPAKPAA